ncbi:hypothetical protein BC936DRAFT_149859 [Jimgerdemannia flammicorona]|uniref:Uncharacterized protein n=1 Tax=Jimgerdemannia flammicorona TaxID=994334 RepID=A0A433DJN9_9FUNG|nr:hypothetical protein BC936DRAFT_149859 [Jimgerdemannia flammicorona]
MAIASLAGFAPYGALSAISVPAMGKASIAIFQIFQAQMVSPRMSVTHLDCGEKPGNEQSNQITNSTYNNQLAMEDYTQTHLMTLLSIQEEDTTTIVPTLAKEHTKPRHTSFFASFAFRRCNMPHPLSIVPGPKSTPTPTRSRSTLTSLSRRKSLLVRSPSSSSDTTPCLSASSSITSNGSSSSPSSSTSTRRRRSMAGAHVERFSVHLSPEPMPSASRTPSLTSNSSEPDSTPQTPTYAGSEGEAPVSPSLYSANGYSNFYLRLPNGKWMLRYRTGDREILGTEEVDMCLI